MIESDEYPINIEKLSNLDYSKRELAIALEKYESFLKDMEKIQRLEYGATNSKFYTQEVELED